MKSVLPLTPERSWTLWSAFGSSVGVREMANWVCLALLSRYFVDQRGSRWWLWWIRLHDHTVLSGFQSRCKRMQDLKLFNVVQLIQLSERLLQLSTILLLKANFLISSQHRLLNNFLECPHSATIICCAKEQIFVHFVIPIQNLKGFD